MANGKHHDHPLTDYLVYGERLFPDDICDLIDQIRAIDPHAFQAKPSPQPYSWEGDAKVNGDWFAWGRGEKLDEARSFLNLKLNEVRKS